MFKFELGDKVTAIDMKEGHITACIYDERGLCYEINFTVKIGDKLVTITGNRRAEHELASGWRSEDAG